MRRLAIGAACAALAMVLTACGYDETPLPTKPEATPAPTPTASDCTTTDADLASYDPGATLPDGPTVEKIRQRGRLIVGVSADTYLMGAEDPRNDNRIVGFDIEFAKAIGAAIFDNDGDGKKFEVGKNLQFRVITAAERIDALKNGDVDLVIRNFTINCSRREEIDFSQVYYNATQKVLVSKSLAESYQSVHDLAGLHVCAPRGSTSLENITDIEPKAIIDPADTHTGCLVKFQRGQVDAITGDDTVLAGLAAQDPYAVVPLDQPSLEPEPYGIGAKQGEVDLVKLVNFVLDQMRREGSWQRVYNHWLGPYLGTQASGYDGATPPMPATPYRVG